MTDFDLLIQLHIRQLRQGPGGQDETLLAARLAGVNAEQRLTIADIGCGTGAAALTLAEHFNCDLTAIDFLPAFIEELKVRAEQRGVANKITAQTGDMANLPFEEQQFDVLWSEGAIYNIGFKQGIKAWRKFLKPGGKIVLSELTWLTQNRPYELTNHWQKEYPEVATAGEKIAQLERNGYKLLGYFPLPEYCWVDNYFQPLVERFDSFKAQFPEKSSEVDALIEEQQQEISMYQKYKAYWSYGVYVAEKIAS
ncbi:SAM-dependent methyltransferase [Thalassotalea agarivorans]|uniref:Methyltransferase domain-containing protein n=1 Tax=Thalassotalea agarivorans TaxID=349064 RepID=A0A1I0B2W7_THASX|nr:class I SAM-dependent methyltransferase [Thalassotalea agarivorans]SET01088.1 Methyltransferase domain-containing protein [Thalassotalea agarivorans]